VLKHLRRINEEVLVIGNAYHIPDAKILYDNGAAFVMMPHVLGAEWISNILRNEEWDEKTMARLKKRQEVLLPA
jgi:hypothetical protein